MIGNYNIPVKEQSGQVLSIKELYDIITCTDPMDLANCGCSKRVNCSNRTRNGGKCEYCAAHINKDNVLMLIKKRAIKKLKIEQNGYKTSNFKD